MNKYTIILDNYEESGKWDFHITATSITEAIDKAKAEVVSEYILREDHDSDEEYKEAVSMEKSTYYPVAVFEGHLKNYA